MRLKDLNELILTWFEKQIRVDAWKVDAPTELARYINGKAYPANTAIIGAIEDMSFVPPDKYTLVYPYAVQYRFSGLLAEVDLPLTEIETLYLNVCQRWIRGASQLDGDIERVFLPDMNNFILVSKSVDVQNDWLVVLVFRFGVVANIDLDATPNLQPITDYGWLPVDRTDVYKLNIGLWRETIDRSGNKLDSEINLEKS